MAREPLRLAKPPLSKSLAPANQDNGNINILRLPKKVTDILRNFLVDGRTGNVQLNIRDGIVLGVTVEEKHSV